MIMVATTSIVRPNKTTRHGCARQQRRRRRRWDFFLLWSAMATAVLGAIAGFLGTAQSSFASSLNSNNDDNNVFNKNKGGDVQNNKSFVPAADTGADADDVVVAAARKLLPGSHLNQSIIYIHIGKTGGTTLDSVLRSNCRWYDHIIPKRNNCDGMLDEQEEEGGGILSMVSRSTKATLHVHPKDEFHAWIDNATAFLVTLRNPISRAVSAFNMGHPSNMEVWRPTDPPMPLILEFYGCFPTVEDLAKAIRSKNKADPPPPQDDDDDDCYMSGLNTLKGYGHPRVAGQFRYNFAYYYKMSFHRYPERPVLALRTEHLWDDLKRVDQLLGGNGIFPQAGDKRTWGSEQYQVKEELSASGVKTFCCFLAMELQIYEILVRKAINLSPSEKETTLNELYEQCGVATPNGTIHPFPWVDWALVPDNMC